ncbi:MAG: hypothetical protein B6I20_02470 [Bacteroidetes bacterium 4572_117]|nr:MAG: hypothetical protein B6I20_02470 [Bacteroidetes bacterium 4572_117]
MSKEDTNTSTIGDILVVEDTFSHRELISEILGSEGYTVRQAVDSESALQIIKAKQPDLVLLDINLPDVDGISFCSHLKSNSETKDFPVIFISAQTDTNMKVKALEAGGVDYVTKPIKSSELLARITTHLNIYKLQLQLKTAQQTLEKSEAKYVDLYNNAPDMFLSINPESFKIIDCNKTLLTDLGYSRDELIGKSVFDFYTLETAKFAKEKLFPQLKKTGSIVGEELQVKKKNGTIIDVLLNSSAVYDEDNKIRYSRSVWREITKRKKAEKSLAQTSEIINLSSMVVFLWENKDNWSVKHVSDNVSKIFGYTHKDFSSDKIYYSDIIHPDDIKRVKAEVVEASNNPQINKFEQSPYRIITKNGEIKWIEDKTVIIRDNVGQITHYQGIIQDITDRIKKEETIGKLSTAINQSPITIVITDTQGNIEFVNPKFTETSGYTLKEAIGKNPRMLKSGIQTDDVYKNLWGTVTKGGVWRGEFKNKRKDGTLYYENAAIGPVKNQKGEITHFIALKEDITEQKEMQQKLKLKSQQIENIFNNVKDVIYSLDVEKEGVLQIAPSCKDIFGYSQNEFYKNPGLLVDIIHPDDQKFAKLSKENFTNNDVLNLKYRIIKPDKQIRWVNSKITPRFNSSGNLTRLDASVSDITASEVLQTSLKQAFNFNNKIIKTSGIGVLMYKQSGQCLSANNNIVKIINTTKEQLLALNFKEVPAWKESGLIKDAKKCLETNNEIKNVIQIKNEDTGEIWLDTHFSTYEVSNEPHFLLLVRDISKIKFAEKEIQQKAIELRNLIQTVSTPIFNMDIEGKIQGWNKAAKKITGYLKAEVENKHFANILFVGDEKQTVHNIIKDAINGHEISNRELMIKTKRGKLIKIMLNINVHRDINGKVIGVICTGQDITELVNYRKKLEKKVKKRTEKLKKALKAEQELSELKSRFVSMASHEFRTPLAAIGFAAGFVKKYWNRLDEEKRDKKLIKIENQVYRMTNMLDDVLTIGKSEAGQLKYKPEIIGFEEFINPLMEEVGNVTNNTHEIRFQNICKLEKIFIDEKLARNIYINLLSNAIKFSPEKKYIEFTCNSKNDLLVFTIRDFGIGINKKDLSDIFTPFHRGENVETIQGTGLGLAIVKESVELMKGKIEVESKPGEGTTFTVTLPKT